MASPVVGMVDECPDLGFKVFRKEVIFEQDPVFQRLVPALDLALGLRMTGSSLHLFSTSPIREDIAKNSHLKRSSCQGGREAFSTGQGLSGHLFGG